MPRLELYSPEGLRVDGRRWNELRNFQCKISTHPNSSDGSSYVEQGNSKIICMVNGPNEPKLRSQIDPNKARIEVNINIANFSNLTRKKRSKNERRIIELTTALENTVQQSIITHLYPRTLIEINIQVLTQDGGLLASITNAMTLALIDAGISMYDYILSISVGLHDQYPLLDLNTLEERDLSYLTLAVIGKSDKLVLLMLDTKVPMNNLEDLITLGVAGCHRLRDLMDEEVKRHGKLRLKRLT